MSTTYKLTRSGILVIPSYTPAGQCGAPSQRAFPFTAELTVTSLDDRHFICDTDDLLSALSTHFTPSTKFTGSCEQIAGTLVSLFHALCPVRVTTITITISPSSVTTITVTWSAGSPHPPSLERTPT